MTKKQFLKLIEITRSENIADQDLANQIFSNYRKSWEQQFPYQFLKVAYRDRGDDYKLEESIKAVPKWCWTKLRKCY